MKKIILVLVVLFCFNLIAQNASKKSQSTTNDLTKIESNSIAFQKEIYNQALSYNDANTAISSLHNLIVLEGIKSTYKDTLAVIYYKSGNYNSSHLVANELLKEKPGNLQLLEIEANSLQNLGNVKESIDRFENLFSKTKNIYHGYQLAVLQFNLKRLIEAKQSVEKALSCEEIKGATLKLPIDKTKTQDVALKAVLYNLLGTISFDLEDKIAAKKAFDESLKIMPDFFSAKENLAYLENQSKNTEPVKSKKNK